MLRVEMKKKENLIFLLLLKLHYIFLLKRNIFIKNNIFITNIGKYREAL